MLVIGITGSIATGKSYIVSVIESYGYKVFDSDDAAKAAYFDAAILLKLYELFPDLDDKSGNELRSQISKIAFEDKKLLKKLEDIIHPFISIRRRLFLEEAKKSQEKMVFLDTPLLYETGLDKICDKVIVTSCDEKIQMQRLNLRGIENEKAQKIKESQLDQKEKLQKTDYIIRTDIPKIFTRLQIWWLLKKLKSN